MGKVLSVVLGLACAVVGVLLLIKWWSSFLGGLKATVPAMLVLGGLVALFAGISEIKDSIAAKKEEVKK
ncbi:MAG: hypothetical protein FJZ16_02780 [Candidatus Omnitrophica bacterium]|nr:hypothetical protein [Candidatus Omnitrophota bacterium]